MMEVQQPLNNDNLYGSSKENEDLLPITICLVLNLYLHNLLDDDVLLTGKELRAEIRIVGGYMYKLFILQTLQEVKTTIIIQI